MSLLKQNFDVQFSGGIQNKADDFTVIPTKLSTLTNGRFVDKNTVRSRGGIGPLLGSSVYADTLGYTSIPTDGPSSYQRLVQLGASLAVESDHGFHVADVAGAKWRQVDFFHQRCGAELFPVEHNAESVLGGDMAWDTTNDIKIYVYSAYDTTLSSHNLHLYAKVVRGSTLIARLNLFDAVNGETNLHPRIIFNATNSKFYIYYVDAAGGGGNGRIRCAIITSAAPTTVASVGTVEATEANVHFDACLNTNTSSQYIYLVHRTIGATSVEHLKLSVTDGTTISASVTSTGTGNAPAYFACVVTTGTTNVAREAFIAAWRTTTPGDGLQIEVADLSKSGAPTVLTSAVGTAADQKPIGRVTLIRDSVDTKAFWCFWDSGEAAVAATHKSCINRIRYRPLSFATLLDMSYTYVALESKVARSVGIGTQPMIYGRDVYLGVYYYSSLQPTFFVLQLGYTLNTATEPMYTAYGNNNIAYRADCGAPAAITTNGLVGWRLPSFITSGNTRVTMQNRSGGDYVLQGTTNTTPIGLDQITLDFDAPVNSIEFNREAILAGGCPKLFDGRQLTELGFNVYPETTAAVDAGSGSLSAGTYGLTYLYEWQDDQGVTHQSAPAVPQSLTVGASGKITWVVTNLRLTQKRNVNIVRYRTAKNGTVYHRVGTTQNDPHSDTQTITGDEATDTTVLSGELLPTTGGVIPPQIYPSCRHVSQHQDRLVFSGLPERDQIQYTEERQGVFFPWTSSDTYSLLIAPEAGRCSATVSMDDKLIVFQESAIGVFMGRGPNRLGLDNSLSNYVRVENAYGLLWSESLTVLQDTEGVWFRDQRGLRHFSRGLQISEVQITETQTVAKGAEIDPLVGTTVGALVFETNKQVVFANGSAGLLIYDYEHKQWSQYTKNSQYSWTCNYPGVYSNQIIFLSSGGVYYESTATEDAV